MFQVNDHVMYGNQGICTVTDICRREINGENISYYVLQPAFDNKSTIFVPCKNAQLTGRSTRIYSKENRREKPLKNTVWNISSIRFLSVYCSRETDLLY